MANNIDLSSLSFDELSTLAPRSKRARAQMALRISLPQRFVLADDVHNRWLALNCMRCPVGMTPDDLRVHNIQYGHLKPGSITGDNHRDRCLHANEFREQYLDPTATFHLMEMFPELKFEDGPTSVALFRDASPPWRSQQALNAYLDTLGRICDGDGRPNTLNRVAGRIRERNMLEELLA